MAYHGTFTTLREAKDFLNSNDEGLIKDRAKRESMTDMVEKAWHDLDWVAQTKQIPSAVAETDSYHHN